MQLLLLTFFANSEWSQSWFIWHVRYYCSDHNSNLVNWNCEERRTGCNQDIQFLITLYINSKPAIGAECFLIDRESQRRKQRRVTEHRDERKHELSIQAVGGLIPTGVNYITCTQSMWLELREEENLPRLIIQTLLFWPKMLSWSSQCLCEWICSHMKREKRGKKWRWCPLGASGGECRSASTCAAAPTLTDTHVWHTYVHPNSIIHVLPSPKGNTQLRLNCTYCIDKC